MTEFSVRPAQRKARMIAAPIESARNAIGRIQPGFRVVGLNRGQFSLIDLITAVLEQVGAASVTVSTWTAGKIEIDAVLTMLRTHRVIDFRLLVDRSFVSRHPGEVRRLRRFGDDVIRQTKTHAKFALIAAGDYRITIRTSMNFNTNARLEQFDMDDDVEIYDFFNQAVSELFEMVPPGLSVSPSAIHGGFKRVLGGGHDELSFDFGEDL